MRLLNYLIYQLTIIILLTLFAHILLLLNNILNKCDSLPTLEIGRSTK